MKIGIFATADRDFGGVYQYIISLVETLYEYKSTKANEIELFLVIDEKCDTFSYFQNKYDIPIIPHNRNKIKLMRYLTQTYWLIVSQIPILKKISIKKSELKNIEATEADLLIIPYPSLIGYFTNIPYIVVIHDLQHIYLRKFFTRLERIERWFNYSIPARNATAVLCDSEFTRKDISNYYRVPVDKVKIMPLHIPEYISNWEIDTHKLTEVKNKYGLPDKFIFYPAQFWHHKNHINLIKAIHRAYEKYDTKINIILSGSKKQNFENSMNEIKQLELERQIKYVGFVENEDMPYIYKSSTALVYASLFDPNGIPIYEAFVMGCPVVSSNVCALPEQVGDAGLMFDPTDIDDMADKLYTIWIDKKLREKLIQNGFNKLGGLSTEIYAQKWIDLISESLDTVNRKS